MKRLIPWLSLDPAARLDELSRVASLDDPGNPALAAAALLRSGVSELLVDARQTDLPATARLLARIAAAAPIRIALRCDPDSAADVGALLAAGAERIVLGRSALRDPELIARLAREFGHASVAVAITTRREGDNRRVLESPAGAGTEWDALTWAAVAEAQGACELLVESNDPGAFGEPFDLELLQSITAAIARPVVAAAPGAVSLEDLFDALMIGSADGVLVRGLLDPGRASLAAIRSYLAEHGLE